MRIITTIAVSIAVCTLLGCRASGTSIPPAHDTLFTSTRCVLKMQAASDGTLWVMTGGGFLRRDMDGAWHKPTTCDIDMSAGQIARFRGKTYGINPEGITEQDGNNSRTIPMPQCSGSHISALLLRDGKLLIAIFGDGLRTFDGKSWARATIDVPEKAREITAMAAIGDSLWIGTRREGVWEYNGKLWKQHLQPDEPFDHDCQSMALFRGRLYIGTLEDGLVIRSRDGWRHVTLPTISSNAPRQMVEFGGILYLRNGDGKIDRFDGDRWDRNAFASLPRKQVSALASDGKRLYAAQWGGWSEFDGTTWTHHLKNQGLQGYPITFLLPDSDTLWVGTQGRGLAEVNRNSGSIKWHDELNGFPDDWVTCLLKIDNTVYAGTFYGGLAYLNNGKWVTVPGPKHQRINDMIPDGKSSLLIAMESGVWHHSNGHLEQLFTQSNSPDREANCLCLTDDGLWVGTRTGIYFTKHLSRL